MKLIRDEKGIALVMVLIFSMIGLAIVSAMLFMLTQGTKVSGSFKVYKSADEAGLGGIMLGVGTIKSRGVIPSTAAALPFGPPGTGAGQDPCLQQKLTSSTASWTSCNAVAARLSMDPTAEDPTCPLDPSGTKHICADMTFDLPGPLGTTFRSYSKIVDTIVGNTDTSAIVKAGELGGQNVAATNSGQISPAHIPYLYTVEVRTQNRVNPNEKSEYSTLYAY